MEKTKSVEDNPIDEDKLENEMDNENKDKRLNAAYENVNTTSKNKDNASEKGNKPGKDHLNSKAWKTINHDPGGQDHTVKGPTEKVKRKEIVEQQSNRI